MELDDERNLRCSYVTLLKDCQVSTCYSMAKSESIKLRLEMLSAIGKDLS